MKYPILLVHGMGFRDDMPINYWGRIPKAFEQAGYQVFYGKTDGNASIETNSAYLREEIEKLKSEYGIERFNVIAHSKGGLDIRHAISSMGMGSSVASVTTISTPHNGSKTVDLLLKLPDFLVRVVAGAANIFLRIIGDRKSDSYTAFHSFSTGKAREFNINNPDNPNVYYQSYSFVMGNFFSDILLWFPCLVVNLIEGRNDGFLTPESTKWGNYRGTFKSVSNRGISHCDEVDLRRKSFSHKKSSNADEISDMKEFYLGIAKELEDKGF